MKRIHSRLEFAVVAILGAAGCSSSDAATTVLRNCDTCRRERHMPRLIPADAVVIDVRTPAEYDAGHLQGAQNINVESSDFAAEVGALPKDQTYVVYCRSGNRLAVAAQQMAGLGFGKVIDAGSVSEECRNGLAGGELARIFRAPCRGQSVSEVLRRGSVQVREVFR